MLNVVYDLRVLPPTYDLPYFLAIAEARMRLETQENRYVLWIITGKSRRPRDWDWSLSIPSDQLQSAITQRLNRVIIPTAGLFPSIASINIVDESCIQDPGLPVFHPVSYDYRNPLLGVYHKGWFCLDYADKIDMRFLKNSDQALVEARRYLEHKLGTAEAAIITVRNNTLSHDQSRNSREDVLRQILVFLKNKNISIGLIPDTSLAENPIVLENKDICLTAPAFDARLRSAIYECCRFSLFEPTGPLVLAQLNKESKFIAYGMAWSSSFDATYQLNRGYARDVNFIAPKDSNQKYLWDSLTVPTLANWIKDFS